MTQNDDIAAIVEGLRKAKTDAIRADRGMFPAFLATLVMLSVVAGFFGHVACFWFGLGAIVSACVALWEAGRNVKIEEAALRAYLLENRDDPE